MAVGERKEISRDVQEEIMMAQINLRVRRGHVGTTDQSRGRLPADTLSNNDARVPWSDINGRLIAAIRTCALPIRLTVNLQRHAFGKFPGV